MKEEINILYILEKIFYVITFFFSSDFRQISAKSFGNKPCKIIQLLNASVLSVHSIYYIDASYLWINLIQKLHNDCKTLWSSREVLCSLNIKKYFLKNYLYVDTCICKQPVCDLSLYQIQH